MRETAVFLASLQLFTLAESLGAVESLAECPAVMVSFVELGDNVTHAKFVVLICGFHRFSLMCACQEYPRSANSLVVFI